jgi:Spy/CpxP family protein refolding chaperone
MFKHCLPILLAITLIAVAAPLAAAQSNDVPPNSQQPAAGHGDWHHGPPDPAERTQELTKKLKLTPDQQTKVQSILESQHSQMEALRQDNSTAPQDRRAKMMEIHQNSSTQIRALLDPTQQKKWDEMQARQMDRHGHPTAGDQAPPPQQ